MTFIYTKAYLKGRINAGIKGKIGMLTDPDETCNQAVRYTLAETDLRSTKRMAYLSPNLFSDIRSYPAPTDIKSQGIIDVRPEVNRNSQSEVTLTTAEEFDRAREEFRCALTTENDIKRLLISIPVNDVGSVVSTLDSLTAGGGTWTAVGDATNLVASTERIVKGAGSIKWDIGAGATTTAGIQNTGLTAFDITEFLSNQIFHYVYLSNASQITNFKLRIGSSTGNYYECTVTETHEETTFAVGWNLLRFDMNSKTTTGTPDDDACTYVSIYMTKDAGKISQTGFFSDHIWLKKGAVYQLSYYTKYGWMNTSGTYLENSTNELDLIVADADEIDIIVQKAIEIAAEEVDEESVEKKAQTRYISLRDTYLGNNPSESKLMQTTYYNF